MTDPRDPAAPGEDDAAGRTPDERAPKAPAKKAPVKKTPARKTPARKTPAKRTPARKTPAKKAPAKKTPAKKAPAASGDTAPQGTARPEGAAISDPHAPPDGGAAPVRPAAAGYGGLARIPLSIALAAAGSMLAVLWRRLRRG